jgi:hypothetical protein
MSGGPLWVSYRKCRFIFITALETHKGPPYISFVRYFTFIRIF